MPDDRAFPCRRLVGKVAIVTGGAGGIGSATARRLAAEGASVVVADIHQAGAEAVAHEIGDAALAVAFDAGDVASVERVVETTVGHFGRLDILHNNAALVHRDHLALDTDIVDIDFDVWDRTFAVNVRGYLAGCKYAIPHMIRQGGGSIVNTGSVSGMLGDLSLVAYGSAKAAILNMTRFVATMYGKDGIRCNAINPGPIRTPATLGALSDEFIDILLRNTALGVWGEPEDIAAAVAWLASDDAKYVTGVILDVDGGLLAHVPNVSEVRKHFGDTKAIAGPRH